VLALCLLSSGAPADPGPSLAEAWDRVAAAQAQCADVPACVAEVLGEQDPRVRLERVAHPDSDSIRWVDTLPSVTDARSLGAGRGLVVLERFGRKANREVEAALAAFGPLEELVLDLRSNRGGDLGRMLRLAGFFAGAQEGALRLIGDGDETRPIDIEGKSTVMPQLTLLVGARTASSAEILAALLRRHAGARLLGETTAGKDYLTRVVPLDHDWRLLLPAERVEVPGETLAGGLVPDGPLPAEFPPGAGG